MKKRAARDTAKVPSPPPGSEDSTSDHAREVNALAASLPFNANKPGEYGEDAADGPEEGQSATPSSPAVTGSTLSESAVTDKTGDPAEPGDSAMEGTLQRVRVDSGGRILTTNQGVAGRRQPELAQGGAAGTDPARRLHPPREDHPLRP